MRYPNFGPVAYKQAKTPVTPQPPPEEGSLWILVWPGFVLRVPLFWGSLVWASHSWGSVAHGCLSLGGLTFEVHSLGSLSLGILSLSGPRTPALLGQEGAPGQRRKTLHASEQTSAAGSRALTARRDARLLSS